MRITKNILFITALMIFCSGCNQYIISTTPSDTYYGGYNRRDMTHADVRIFKVNSSQICDGSIYLNAPSRSITMKNDRVDAKMKLGCNDGTLLDITWKLRKASFNDGTGEGYDQFNNKYEFSTIPKSVYKKYAGNKRLTFPSDKNKSYLKY